MIAYALGEMVVERIGDAGDNRFDQRTQIVAVDGNVVTTASGNRYHAMTGRREPANSQPYRSIRSMKYESLL